jgi:low affinity Fe/Cu permease
MKVLIVLAFIVIFAALAAAGAFMMRGSRGDPKGRSKNMAWALTVRIGVSVLLFLCILISWKLGWIHPNGIAAGA